MSALNEFLDFPRKYLLCSFQKRSKDRDKSYLTALSAAAASLPTNPQAAASMPTNQQHKQEGKPQPIRPHLIKKVVALCREGHVGKGARMLFDGEQQSIEWDEAIAAIPALFPIGNLANRPPNVASTTFVTSETLLPLLKSSRSSKAPGLSGWTEELLFSAIEGNPLTCSALCKLTQDIVDGTIAPKRLFSSRLIMLRKSSGGLRPICVSETVVKLATAWCVQRCSTDLNLILKHQYGLREGGAESIVHAARKSTEENMCIISLDCKNAFGSVCRSAMSKSLYSHPQLAPMFRLFYSSYGTPFSLEYTRKDQSFTHMASSGGKQGDPMMSACFALALNLILSQIEEEEDLRVWAFMDDICIATTPEIAIKLVPWLEGELMGIGLTLNKKKCEVFSMDVSQAQTISSALQFTYKENGIKILGAFLSFDHQACEDFLQDSIDSHALFFKHLSQLPKNIALEMVLKCGTPRWSYIARTHSPADAMVAHKRFDSLVKYAVMRILEISDIEELPLDFLMLPQKSGGLGVALFEHIGEAAYLASRSGSGPFDSQHALTAALHAKIAASIDSTELVHHRAACSRRHASAWLTPKEVISDKSFCAAVRFRLQVNQVAAYQHAACTCGFLCPPAEFATHLLGCTKGTTNGPTLRHSHVIATFVNFLRNNGLIARAEPQVEGLKRADVEVFVGGENFLIDFTIFNSTAPSYRKKNLVSILQSKERKKKQLYGESVFVFAIEVCGGFSQECLTGIKKICKLSDIDPHSLISCLSVAVQEGNGRILSKVFPTAHSTFIAADETKEENEIFFDTEDQQTQPWLQPR